jgi:hypothetical protein
MKPALARLEGGAPSFPCRQTGSLGAAGTAKLGTGATPCALLRVPRHAAHIGGAAAPGKADARRQPPYHCAAGHAANAGRYTSGAGGLYPIEAWGLRIVVASPALDYRRR